MEAVDSTLFIAEAAQVKEEHQVIDHDVSEIAAEEQGNAKVILVVQQHPSEGGEDMSQSSNDQTVAILKNDGFDVINHENGLEHQYTAEGGIRIAEIANVDDGTDRKTRENHPQLIASSSDVSSCSIQVKEEQEIAAYPQQFVILTQATEETEGFTWLFFS